MYRRAVSTVEGVKADALFSYQPPLNLLALVIMFPASYILTPRWFHKVNVFMIRYVYFINILTFFSNPDYCRWTILKSIEFSHSSLHLVLWTTQRSIRRRHVLWIHFVCIGGRSWLLTQGTAKIRYECELNIDLRCSTFISKHSHFWRILEVWGWNWRGKALSHIQIQSVRPLMASIGLWYWRRNCFWAQWTCAWITHVICPNRQRPSCDCLLAAFASFASFLHACVASTLRQSRGAWRRLFATT